MATEKFTPDDIIILGLYDKYVFPKKLSSPCKRTDNTGYIITKKFFMTSTLKVVDKFTRQYTIVYRLMIIKKDKEYYIENKQGITVKELAKFLIKVCNNVLPVNIITNNILLSSICKYIFQNYLIVDNFPGRDPKCQNNTKVSPKVIVWTVFDEKNNKKIFNFSDIIQFIHTYPKNKRTVTVRRKHVYLKKKLLNIITREEKEEEQSLWFLERYGGYERDDQKLEQPKLCFKFDPLSTENDALSILRNDRFIKMYINK